MFKIIWKLFVSHKICALRKVHVILLYILNAQYLTYMVIIMKESIYIYIMTSLFDGQSK